MNDGHIKGWDSSALCPWHAVPARAPSTVGMCWVASSMTTTDKPPEVGLSDTKGFATTRLHQVLTAALKFVRLTAWLEDSHHTHLRPFTSASSCCVSSS